MWKAGVSNSGPHRFSIGGSQAATKPPAPGEEPHKRKSRSLYYIVCSSVVTIIAAQRPYGIWHICLPRRLAWLPNYRAQDFGLVIGYTPKGIMLGTPSTLIGNPLPAEVIVLWASRAQQQAIRKSMPSAGLEHPLRRCYRKITLSLYWLEFTSNCHW